MDTEWRQVVRDLRRRSQPGDASERAAAWIEQSNRIPGNAAPPGPDRFQFDGLRQNDEAQQHAYNYISRNQPAAQPDDHTTRDMLTKETLAILRQERDHEIASSELDNDHDYISYIGEVLNGQYRHISVMLSLVSRFAGEVPHDLLDSGTAALFKDKLESDNYASRQLRVQALDALIQQRLPNHTWETFVDPGLVGNARIACHEVGTMIPGLSGLTMPHVHAYVQRNDEPARSFWDFFCSVVASVWRVNSVMAAQPYKTKYEHEAVLRSLQFSARRLAGYYLQNNRIQYYNRRPPVSLQQLRAMNNGPFVE